ncbi:MAG: DUF4159 domain-containing protein [Beijerinckiaceae bacterium]|nr:DUF4159 domain-containing protein [Beijerinckiaceae bacterium]MCZ8301032.1 DUF4159 domain-containing protein [Beijerinckiaceae bacterium]
MIAGLSFLAPLALIALVALPAILFLLRITPPPPRRLPLPTLPLVKDILGKEREPARTPWWLLVLRLLAAAAIILAVAGPRWQPSQDLQLAPGQGPLIVLVDDGWAAAGDWPTRISRAQAMIEQAASRPVQVIGTSEERPSLQPETAATALSRLLSLRPKPYFPQREAAFDTALAAGANASIIWISDGIRQEDEAPRIDRFVAAAGNRLDIIAMQPSPVLALAGLTQNAEGVEAVIRRPAATGQARQGLIRAYDDKGRLLGDTTFALAAEAREATARLTLPIELVNDITRLEIADEKHAGAVHLLDSAHRRRRVALISGETTDTAQPLVSARYFVSRALQPFSDLREPPRGVPDPIARALEERPDVLVLVDIGTLAGETAASITRFVENGGMLIRFAGPGLAAASDDLLPVKLRRGGRILGGALSWDKPRRLGAYPEASPFFGLAASPDIQVERQVLAEPDAELSRASWAVLEDGTPLVTGIARGKGHIVLFHVTGDTSWSNLPLSGAFVDMLRRTLLIARSAGAADAGTATTGRERLAARNTLDGFGQLGGPSPTARPIDPRYTRPGTSDHPPGFYGPAEAGLAVNALTLATAIEPIRFGPARVTTLSEGTVLDFRPWLMLLAVALFVADALAVALLGGLAGALRGRGRLAARTAAILLGLGLLSLAAPTTGFAQGQAPAQTQPQSSGPDLRSIRQEDIRSSLRPRLAYVITGDSRIDEASRAGLAGLSNILQQRTSISLDEPIGLDPGRDELVFYSMIYWPILAGQAPPQERAIRAIDTFMKQGGTVIFDTRDAFVQRPGGMPTAETRALRAMLASLDIPALEPIPPDHVLTKTFYLLDRFVGRYAAGDTWVETLAGPRDAKTPARAGDRVSPIIITSNDLAAAWAVDRLGNPMFPLVPGEPRQREMAFRTGVNIVMYVMTGNYKADQVHVPALLERLGQ